MIEVGHAQQWEMQRLKQVILRLSAEEQREIMDHITGKRFMSPERGRWMHDKLAEMMKSEPVIVKF